MARTRTKENVAEEWSCPLCTLLNTPKDDRCAACNNARPPVDQLRKAQPSERSTANATTSEVQHIYRPASGVFFSSLPIIQSDSGAVNTWKQEPRLAVNRQRGIRRRNAVINVNTRVSGEQVEKSFDGRTTGSTVVDAAKKEDAKVIAQVPSATVTVGLREQAEEKQEEDEEDTGIEEPSFNLLGFGASVFVAQPVPDAVEDQCAANETKNREKSEELCSSDDDMEVLSPPPKYPGFMPASKVLVEETKIEEKLASAGLDLSDSEDEDEPKMLRRRSEDKDNSWEDKWVCQICRNLNDQTALECSICKCNRYRSPVESMEAPLEPVAKSDLQWACHICTNLNPPEASDCLMCLSTRKNDKTTGRRWKCSVCATFNESGAVRCELCDSSRAKSPKKTPGKQGLQCSVCTNINPPGKNRCELCDSSLLDEDDEEGQFVDLPSSIQDRTPRYNEDDLENPYADLSQYDNSYNAPNEVADADLDYVEEISDNEQPSSFLSNPRPVSVREDLKEFENFISMEDLRRDYGCRINFNQMFAGQRSGKSYSDRLATRTAASRKRKRTAAQIESGELPASAARKGKKTKAKAAKGGKKRKSPAAGRRASEGGAKATRGKRAKKTTSSTRRSSSATTYSSGINHYDDSAADFGEDLNTMAWEGVGSAGYL